MPDEVTFQLGPALLAGFVSSFVVLIVIIMMLAVAPTRFPVNPLYLMGSAFSIDTTAAYGLGLSLILLSGIAYGIVVSAVLTGFEAESLEFLWGAIAGAALSVVSGTTLAYARTLNRAVRSGQVGDPGPFLVRYGKPSVGQFTVAHVLFGAVSAQVYSLLL